MLDLFSSLVIVGLCTSILGKKQPQMSKYPHILGALAMELSSSNFGDRFTRPFLMTMPGIFSIDIINRANGNCIQNMSFHQRILIVNTGVNWSKRCIALAQWILLTSNQGLPAPAKCTCTYKMAVFIRKLADGTEITRESDKILEKFEV